MESTNRRLMWHGMCLFLLGLPDSPLTASYGRPCDMYHSFVPLPQSSLDSLQMFIRPSWDCPVLMLLVLAAAPAVLCASYLAQNTQSHSCCPSDKAPVNTSVRTCCIDSPAVTTQSVDVPAPTVAVASTLAFVPTPVTVSFESAAVADLGHLAAVL